MYAYIDESGDLGFSKKSTSFFVVGYLILERPIGIQINLKRLLKRLHKRRKYAREAHELKFSKSSDYVRRKVLSSICKSDVEIGFIVLEKAKVKLELREKRTILYNFIIVDRVMRDVLPSLGSADNLYIIIDRSLPRSSREAFNSYARNKASWLLTVLDKVYPIELSNIEVHHKNSQNEPCLQAADFLAGAGFHRWELDNTSYYDIIKEKVRYFDYLWR